MPTYKIKPADDHYETGTQNFEGIAGARAAVEYIASVGERFGADRDPEFAGLSGRRHRVHTGMRAMRVYEMGLFARLLDGLSR